MIGWEVLKVAQLIPLKPHASEKSYALSEQRNTYVFKIPKQANAHSIARAIASQFGVSVVDIRLAKLPGKTKRSTRRAGRNIYRGKRTDIRKAYVTLKEGESLPIFSAVEEAANDNKETK